MPPGDAASSSHAPPPDWLAAAIRSVDASPEGRLRAWDRLLAWASSSASKTKPAPLPPPEYGLFAGNGGPGAARPARIVWEGVVYRGRIGWLPPDGKSDRRRRPPSLDAAGPDQDWALWISPRPLAEEALRHAAQGTTDPRIFWWRPAPLVPFEEERLLEFMALETLLRASADASAQAARTLPARAAERFRQQAAGYVKIVDDCFTRGLWLQGGRASLEPPPRYGGLRSRAAEGFRRAVAERFPQSARLPAADARPFDDATALRLINGWIRPAELADRAARGKIASDVDRFGRFLQLSSESDPRRLSEAGGAQVQEMRSWLAARPPGPTPVADVYRRFAGLGDGGAVYGLTRRRVDLYLLFLVRTGEVRLHLRGLQPVDRKPRATDGGETRQLESSNLVHVEATTGMLESMHSVEWIPPEQRVNTSTTETAKEAPSRPPPAAASAASGELRKFIERHRREDPAEVEGGERYERAPFDAPIVDAERSAVFQMHPYWSKKPHGAIRRYLEHFTRPGDLVLDPFTGSGGVNSTASALGRPSVGVDLSPAAVFIAHHLCTPFSVPTIEALYHRMTDELSDVRQMLYGSTCHRCRGPAETRYVVWSQRYRCPACRGEALHVDFAAGERRGKERCPLCGGSVSTRAERLGYIPIEAVLECEAGCGRVVRGARAEEEIFKSLDVARIDSLKKEEIPYWHPRQEFSTRWVSWRPNLAEIGDVSGFFTVRNLWAAAAVRDWIERNEASPGASWLLFSLTASLMSISKKAQHLDAGGGYIPGNYVFPPQIKERNVFTTLESLVKKTLRGVAEVAARRDPAPVHLTARSARDLQEIPDDSIDYVFTDPPYSDKVPFGEFNFLWEVWLRKEVSWDQDEILVNPKLGKGLREWREMLGDVARELFRVLKPGRWISICYHDDSAGAWMHLQRAFSESGFLLEEREQTLSIERGRKSWKQATTLKSQKRDLVVNFRKPRPDEAPPAVEAPPRRPFHEEAEELLREILAREPGWTADRLYDEFVSRMVRRRRLERHDFHGMLAELAERRGDGWFRRIPPGAPWDAADAAREQTAMHALEEAAWKDSSRLELPFERLAALSAASPAEVQLLRPLEEALPEHFIRTGSGAWRPPQEAERIRLAALRSSGDLHRLRRFAAALAAELPSVHADRPRDTAELLGWLRFARTAGWPERGVLLYERGGLILSELAEPERDAAEADHAACRAARPTP